MSSFLFAQYTICKKTRFASKARCKASEYQGRSQRRVDSICEGYQIRECTAFEYQGQSGRRECDVCMRGCAVPDVLANPESIKDPKAK